MGKKAKKSKAIVNKESIAECWCFVCKDGGDLRICDHGQCLKSYHSECLEKDDSFLESEDYWACAWHTCFVCQRASRFKCYTCTNAVCSRCLRKADFLKVKGSNGFCNVCLKLAVLVEEKKDYDSDGEKVDFTDRETFEGLFMEYYVIIKEAEGFSLEDIYAAQNQNKKKKNHQPDYVEEFDEDDEEEEESDLDDSETEKKSQKKLKRKKLESAKQTPAKSNGKGFTGWASSSLVQFLSAIGKRTSEKLSQEEVTSIVNDYVKENKFYHQERKRMIVCDDHLKRLFKRRMINRYRVYDLLETHFAENHEESEDDVAKCDSDDSSRGVSESCKRQRKPGNKTQNKEPENNMIESCFASVVIENLKLVYLKRTLLHELFQQSQSYDEKVIGCFVRVRSDPHDCTTRTSHLLRPIKGVNHVSGSGKNAGIILLFSDMPREVHLSLVSDDDFTEEECEDLKRKMLDGQFERLTVVDLQEKAKLLHKEITKHRICKELAKLRHLIDRANEKGWRYEMFEYLEKKKKLQDPSVQQKMLEDVPKVIPDVYVRDSSSGDITLDEGSPESMVQEAAAEVYPTTPAPERPLSTSKVKQNEPDDEQPIMFYRRTRSRKCMENSKSEVIELCDNEEDSPTQTSPMDANEDTDSKIWRVGGQNPDNSSLSSPMSCAAR